MGELRLKKKKKNVIKIKYILYLIIIYVTFSYTFYVSIKNNNNITNEKFIKALLSNGNANIIKENKFVDTINDTVNYLFNINFKEPKSLLASNIYSKNDLIDVTYNDDYSNMEELQKISSYISDPYNTDIDNPLVYIYNSHQLENYDNYNLDIYGITPNVLMASYILKEKLNSMGISTIVETTNLSSFLSANGWDYSSSYKASRLFMLNNISKYSSLKYFIDIHRDSVNKNLTTTVINGKTYARVLFVVGLEHSNYQENLDNVSRFNVLCEKYYPNLSRGIYKKEGKGVNGIYNQDINGNVILIELGGVDNNINEVFNTIEALSNVIYYYINGEDL